MRGIRRSKGTTQRKVQALDIRALMTTLKAQTRCSATSTAIWLRNRALLLGGFAGAFRRSELTNLSLGDLRHDGRVGSGTTEVLQQKRRCSRCQPERLEHLERLRQDNTEDDDQFAECAQGAQHAQDREVEHLRVESAETEMEL